MEKYLGDLAFLTVVLLACAVIWEQKKIKPIFKLLIVVVLAILTGLFVTWHHHLMVFAPTVELVDEFKTSGHKFAPRWIWFRLISMGIVIGITVLHVKNAAKPKSWLVDQERIPAEPTSTSGKAKPAAPAKPASLGKRDHAAYWATIISGTCCALAMLLVGTFWSLLLFALAILSEVSIMNIQVPEQKLYTPTLFGKRQFSERWMLGEYCFGNGWHWMLYPRNLPGLSFNVAEPREGIVIACKTPKVPTRGYQVGDTRVSGGEVDVEFSLYMRSHRDLDAFYSSPDKIRNDPEALAAYAAEVFAPEFRELLKGKDLDEIQTGNVFDGQEFKTSRKLFENGTGHEVTLVRAKDPTATEEVRAQINALAAKQIEKVEAALEADIEATRQGGVGKGRLAQLEYIAEALRDPDKGASIKEALAAVRSMDFAAHSNLRVLVEKELGSLAPLMDEASED